MYDHFARVSLIATARSVIYLPSKDIVATNVTISIMLALELLTWWYGRGWKQIVSNAEQRFVKVSHMFSVPVLLRTLFSPWRRIITYPSASLDAKFRAMGDNLVSRAVGFTVRFMVLVTAALFLGVMAVYSLLEILLWPFVPLLSVFMLVKGIIG